MKFFFRFSSFSQLVKTMEQLENQSSRLKKIENLKDYIKTFDNKRTLVQALKLLTG